MPTEFLVTITAEGVVHDADGNLVEQFPFEATAVVDEETAMKILASATPLEEQP